MMRTRGRIVAVLGAVVASGGILWMLLTGDEQPVGDQQAAAELHARSAVSLGSTYLCTSNGCKLAGRSVAAAASVPAPPSPVLRDARTDCDLDGGPYPLRFDVQAVDVPSGQLRWGPCKGVATPHCNDNLLNSRRENRCITTESELRWIGAWAEFAVYGCSPPPDLRPVELPSWYIDDIGTVPGLALSLRCASACGAALPICPGGPRPTPTPTASPTPTPQPTPTPAITPSPTPAITPTPRPTPTATPTPSPTPTPIPLPSGAKIRADLTAVRGALPADLRRTYVPAVLAFGVDRGDTSKGDRFLGDLLAAGYAIARAESGGTPGPANLNTIPAAEAQAYLVRVGRWLDAKLGFNLGAAEFAASLNPRSACVGWKTWVEIRRGLRPRPSWGCAEPTP